MGTHKDHCPDCKRLEAVVALLQEQLNRALARIADLESESCASEKELHDLLQAAVQRHRQAATSAGGR